MKYRFFIADQARDNKLWNGKKWVPLLNGSQKGYSSKKRAFNAAAKLAKRCEAFNPVIVEIN